MKPRRQRPGRRDQRLSHSGMMGLVDSTNCLIVTARNAFSVAA
jgi:hypothetical protein